MILGRLDEGVNEGELQLLVLQKRVDVFLYGFTDYPLFFNHVVYPLSLCNLLNSTTVTSLADDNDVCCQHLIR
jgi:hypothetical protein